MTLIRTNLIYDRTTTSAFATVVAQIVPVLLLTAMVTPLRRRTKPGDAARAFLELLATGLLVAVSVAAELFALFGVLQGGLTRHDVHALIWLLLATAALATFRMLTPLAISYAAMSKEVPEARVLGLLAIFTATGFAAIFYLVNALVG